MTSEIRANTLKNRVGLGTVSFTNTGPVVSGIVTIANSTAAGVTLEDNAGVGNSLKITTPTGYVSIGAGNATFVHLNTDRGIFYFQRRITVDEGIISSYDENLVLQSPVNTTRLTINKDTGLVSVLNDLDVDGHTNLDNVSIAGISTFGGDVSVGGELQIADYIVHTGDGNTAIRFPSNDTITFQTTNVERLRIKDDGVFQFNGTNSADNTNKLVYITSPSYDTDEENFGIIHTGTYNNQNLIYFGGGAPGSYNACTLMKFYTTPSVNTLTGTERLCIESWGGIQNNQGAIYGGGVANEPTVHFSGAGPSNDLSRGHLAVSHSAAYNSSPIARISLATRYNSSGGYTFMGGIEAGKANTTDGNYDGFVRLMVRRNGQNNVEGLRINANGDVTTTGQLSFNRQNAGFTARSGDAVSITRASGTPLEINRTGSDGQMIGLLDDNSYEAAIGLSGGSLVFGLPNVSSPRLTITSAGRVLIGDAAATSLLSVGGANYNWDNGDVPMVLIKGHNNEAPTSGSENIAFQIEDENNNLIHKVWNTGGGNSDYGIAYYAGKLGINDTSPTTKVNIKIGTSTQWSSSKNVSNTTNLDFLALDLINTDNNNNSEVGLMMEAGSSSAAQMTISTKKVSANYAELAIRTRDGGSASKEIWKLRGNGVRYVRTGATISIESGAKDASITPNNGDYVDFARVNYAGAAMGEIFIKWTSVVAPACCHHGSAHLRIGSEYHTYFYGWNDWVDVVSSAAHNSGWFSHWRLRRVTVSGTSYLYLQGKWDGSNVSAGTFQVVIGKSAYHPNGGGLIEALTPVVDNNENGDTSGSKTYGAVQAQVQGKREKDSPATDGDRITKSHSGRFHSYLGLSSHGEISAYNQPRMSANKNAGQTYTTTPTIVTYGNEHFDNGNDYNPSTSTYTCPMDGVYYVSYSTNVDAFSQWQYLECRVNGSAAFTHSRIMHLNFPRLTLQGSNFVNCSQGDEIAIYGWTSSGTNGGDNFGLFQVYMLS